MAPDPPRQPDARDHLPHIFHLALGGEWRAAVASTTPYRRSTRGKALDEVGFIHCSFADQVQKTAELFYADATDVVVLEIDPSRVPSPIRVERVGTAAEAFPHVYGPIPLDAVVEVRPHDG